MSYKTEIGYTAEKVWKLKLKESREKSLLKGIASDNQTDLSSYIKERN